MADVKVDVSNLLKVSILATKTAQFMQQGKVYEVIGNLAQTLINKGFAILNKQ